MSASDQSGGPGGWWRRWRAKARAERARVERARRLYADAAARARRPRLYTDFGVPDTPDGRFEMLGLEIALVLRRLRSLGDPGTELARSLLEVLVEDLDRNLREMGIGDLSVGRYVKRMVGSLLARAEELARILDRDDEAALRAFLRRTAWPGVPEPSDDLVRAFAAEVACTATRLQAIADAALLAGRLDEKPEFSGESG